MNSPLSEIVREEIADSGPIPFCRFMELALYHPEYGYYTSGRSRIGKRGDFFTSVSVGPLFGKLLARQVLEMWRQLVEPTDFTIVEQGANDAQLALDILCELKDRSPECFEATTYRIVEPSERLAALQREKLAGHAVKWTPSVAELPLFTGVHLSNELLDAFPVHVVEWTGDEWIERCVNNAADGFGFVARPLCSAALKTACAKIPLPLPKGYVTEVNLATGPWLQELAARIDRGYILAIDYGHLREDYYHPERVDGTLSAYADHRREPNPLTRPGEIDLTAQVDFTTLIEAAASARLEVAGYTDQHHFMVGLGADHFAAGASPSELRQFQTLMHPAMLGQTFKMLVLTKGEVSAQLAGLRYARPIAKE